MSSPAWNWLPDDALSSPEVLGLVDQAITEWSDRWFRNHRLVRQQLRYASAPTFLPSVASTARFTLRSAPATVEALAGQALDADLSRLEKTEGDHVILSALSDDLLKDLAETLEACFGPVGIAPDDIGAADGVLIELVTEEGRKAVAIETSRAVLAQARLAALPERAPRGDALTPIRTAMADVTLTLSARLGSAEISLPEARRLAPGDVIVLDRPLDEALDLVPSTGGAALACARLVDAASPHSLRLEPAVGKDRR